VAVKSLRPGDLFFVRCHKYNWGLKMIGDDLDVINSIFFAVLIGVLGGRVLYGFHRAGSRTVGGVRSVYCDCGAG